MPALTDTTEGGDRLALVESEGILAYLVQRHDPAHKISFPAGTREALELQSWLFFMAGTCMPKASYGILFNMVDPARDWYAAKKFRNEILECVDVVERRLAASRAGWLVGDRYSAADITTFSWTRTFLMVDLPMDRFPHIKAWHARIEARPAVVRGCAAFSPVPEMTLEERTAYLKDWYSRDYERRAKHAAELEEKYLS
ncbi:hypothetical protein KEM52_002749 [Ascosphaera acerosa]|nr:hypothetical protein KEM52_002749 [Ascosphaera acerosa]